MGWKMVEYECDKCGLIFESLESQPVPKLAECPKCEDRYGVLIISAPMGHVRVFEVQRGGVDETPPGCISTKPKDW